MNWHELTLKPRDTLFFRDARPMAGGGIGEGAQWPLPHTMHGALHTALYQQVPERQAWETTVRRPKREVAQASEKTTEMRFGNLRSVGPFPVREDEIQVPTPKDLVLLDEGKADAEIGFLPVDLPNPWRSNLPTELACPVARTGKPSKAGMPAWISLGEFQRYLEGHSVHLTPSSDLWDVERNVGIALDDKTGTTRDLYQAEKMRLRPKVQLRAFATLAGTGPDLLDEVFQKGGSVLFGGENSGVIPSALRRLQQDTPMEFPVLIEGARVKWTLITPALFRTGWKPAWVDDAGKVRLPSAPCEREPGERREDWRRRVKEIPPIDAELVSALVPSPRHVSGWKLGDKPVPRKTERLVEAGAVFYFNATDNQQAQLLVKALQGIPRSDSLGEKGYGYGFCSTWNSLSLKTLTSQQG